jgi:hypothetical protein
MIGGFGVGPLGPHLPSVLGSLPDFTHSFPQHKFPFVELQTPCYSH